jgi:hypothetical protein
LHTNIRYSGSFLEVSHLVPRFFKTGLGRPVDFFGKLQPSLRAYLHLVLLIRKLISSLLASDFFDLIYLLVEGRGVMPSFSFFS